MCKRWADTETRSELGKCFGREIVEEALDIRVAINPSTRLLKNTAVGISVVENLDNAR